MELSSHKNTPKQFHCIHTFELLIKTYSSSSSTVSMLSSN